MAVSLYYPLSGQLSLNDFSGNNSNLINSNCVFINDGIKRNSYFNNNNGQYNYLYCNDIPLPSDKTLSFCIKTFATPTANSYFVYHGNLQRASIRYVNSGFRLYFYGGEGFCNVPAQSINLLTRKWIHFVIKYNFTNKNIQVYRDSILIYNYNTAENILHITTAATMYILGTLGTSPYNTAMCEFLADSELWSAAKIKTEYARMKGLLNI